MKSLIKTPKIIIASVCLLVAFGCTSQTTKNMIPFEVLSFKENYYKALDLALQWDSDPELVESQASIVTVYTRENTPRIEFWFESINQNNPVQFIVSCSNNHCSGNEYASLFTFISSGFDSIDIFDIVLDTKKVTEFALLAGGLEYLQSENSYGSVRLGPDSQGTYMWSAFFSKPMSRSLYLVIDPTTGEITR